jgi:hypothetical protein
MRDGAIDDSWRVLVAGLGRWRKLEGASRNAPSKVSGGGAHPSVVPAAKGQSSGGRLHTSTPNVEVVASGNPGEVLWLGRGYAVVRHEPIWKRRRGYATHRGGKRWWRFSTSSVRAVALRCSRLMHGLG